MKWLLIPLLLPSLLRAAEITVEAPGVPVQVLYVSAGKDAPVDLVIEAPAGPAVTVRADLWQLTSGLAAPLRKDLAVGEGALDFAGTTRRQIRWTVTLPPVSRITRLALQFRARRNDGPWQAAGRLELQVYPSKSAEWQGVAERTGVHLAVFGPPDSTLRALLKAQDLNYTDLGIDLPNDLPDTVTPLGEMMTSLLQTWLASHKERKGALIVLCRDAESLPAISLEAEHGFCLAKITTTASADFLADPRGQKALADTINRALDLAAAP